MVEETGLIRAAIVVPDVLCPVPILYRLDLWWVATPFQTQDLLGIVFIRLPPRAPLSKLAEAVAGRRQESRLVPSRMPFKCP